MSFNSNSFDRHNTLTLQEGSGYTVGDGEDMAIWTAGRIELLQSLVAGNPVTNKSRFQIPGGVLGQGFDNQQYDNEIAMGLEVKGEATSQDGELTGTMLVYHADTGGVLYEDDVTGLFSAFIGPSIGVTDGEDVDEPLVVKDMAFQFDPAFDGLAYDSQNVRDYHEITYSGVEGTVIDVDGNPVEAAVIDGGDESTTTDQSGEYSLIAPVGTETDLLGLKETKIKSFTAPSDGTATVDWQFAGIRVRVRDPDGNPIENVSVEFGDTQLSTNSQGRATFGEAGLGVEYEVRLFQSDALVETIPAPDSEGSLAIATAGQENDDFGGGGDGTGPYFLDITVTDASNGDPIRGILITEVSSGETARSNGQGQGTMYLPTDADEVAELAAGTESARYRAEVVSEDLEYGTMNDVTISLTPSRYPTQK